MSLASVGLSLIHETTIERDASTGTNPWGGKDTPDWQPYLTDLPCRYWVTTGMEQTDAISQVVVEDMRLIVQLGTDVTEQDRLGDITYRGATIVAGPVGIRAVLAHHDHLELVLVRIS
jgi:hypothetical protein